MVTNYVDVGSDSLAAILVAHKEYEPFPEPFRMQPTVCFRVSFEEYKKFISTLDTRLDVLFCTSANLLRWLEEDCQEKLLRSFYMDMAFAVGKELHFAEANGCEATKIRHSFSIPVGTKNVGLDEGTIKRFRVLLGGQKRGLGVPAVVSEGNEGDWKYACKLVCEGARKAPTMWVESN